MKILLADDERELSRAVAVILEHSGYEVDCAYNGAEAVEMLDKEHYDIFLLDIMMPEKNGIEVLEYIRSSGITSPVIMLTAKAELDDKVNGLDAGANDYITKPFAMKELLARIRAAARSNQPQAPVVTRFGNLSLNKDTYEMSSAKSSFRLSNMEFEMLDILIRAEGREIEAEYFIEKVWDGEGDINEVKLYISYLRKKLDALDSEMIIKKSVYDSYRLERKEE